MHKANPGEIIKINLFDFTRSQTLNLDKGGGYLQNGVIDSNNQYAYYITEDRRLVKYDLQSFQQSGDPVYLTTNGSGETNIKLDNKRGFLYVASEDNPALLKKIDPSTLSIVKSITLSNSGVGMPRAMVIDEDNGYLYIGNHENSLSVSSIVRVDIGVEADGAGRTFEEEEYLNFSSYPNEYNFWAAIIDTTNGYAYFGTDHENVSYGKIIKIDINPLRTFQRVESIDLASYERHLSAAVIDTANNFAYFGTYPHSGSIEANVVRVDISPGHFSRVGSVAIPGGVNLRNGATIDIDNQYAYFTEYIYQGASKIYRIDINPSSTLSHTGTLLVDSSEPRARSLVFDSSSGYAYLGLNTRPGKLIKMSFRSRAQYQLEYGIKTSSCQAISSWTAIPAYASAEHWEMVDSQFLSDGEESSNLPDGITDSSSLFKPGRIHDSSNPATEIVFNRNEFTEVEFSIKSTSNANDNCNYCFRLTNPFSDVTYLQYPEVYVSSEPTLITLASLTAKQRGKKVILKWETETELNNLGFNILRSESEDGEYKKINKRVITAKGSSTKGAKYKFRDRKVERGKAYFYKLEDIDSKTGATEHGPVSVEVTVGKKKS